MSIPALNIRRFGFPHNKAEPLRSSPAPTPAVLPANGIRILVADDDATLRNLVVIALRRQGLQVRAAADGEQAWDALRAEPADLLITDQEMPRLQGLELIRRLRIDHLDLPVILISGRMPWENPDLGHLLQPGTTLEKPFTLPALIAKVGSLLAHAATKEKLPPASPPPEPRPASPLRHAAG